VIADRERIDAACPASGVDATVDWQAARSSAARGSGSAPSREAGSEPSLNAPADTRYGGSRHGRQVIWYMPWLVAVPRLPREANEAA
jgi:hypothetical protein